MVEKKEREDSGNQKFIPLRVAVLTISSTRGKNNDKSGSLLEDLIVRAGHYLEERCIVPDNIYQIRSTVSHWISNENVDCAVLTGGTGYFPDDMTPEAVKVLFDREITGFGELFRAKSFQEIGSSAIQSRALAGLANNTLLFCLPGSPNACKTGWNIIEEQLDRRKKQCNFIKLIRREQHT